MKMQLRLPSVFSVQRLPLRVVIITALLSYGLQLGAIIQAQPIYVIVGLTLLPWILVFAFEYIWKYEHYGFFAFLPAFVLAAFAFALMLERHPEHRGRVGMLALLDPSRQDIREYTDYLAAAEREARAVVDRPSVRRAPRVPAPGLLRPRQRRAPTDRRHRWPDRR